MINEFFKSNFNSTDSFIIVETLCKGLYLSKRTIYRRIAKGDIKTTKISGCHFIKISDLKKFIQEV